MKLKLNKIAESYGYDSIDEMLKDIPLEELENEAICVNCFYIYDESVEPDAHGIECPTCHKTSVQSLYICLGII